MKKGGAVAIVIICCALLIVVTGVVYGYNKYKSASMEEGVPVTESTYDANTLPVVAQGHSRDIAPLILAKLPQAEESDAEVLSEGLFVYDPANRDNIIVAAHNGQGVNRFYVYNLKTGALSLMHEGFVDENQNPQKNIIVGTQEGKVIVSVQDIDFVLEKCESIWSSASRNSFKYLDLAFIEAGLSPYAVPEYKIQEAETFERECGL